MTVPALAPRLDHLAGTVYSNLVRRFGRFEGERFPLHVGDTWLQPPEGARTEDVHHADHPEVNRYTPVPGWPPLLAALRDRVAARTGVPVVDDAIAVTVGATGGLSLVLGAMVPPGGEVIVLAPAWPLFAGAVRAWGGTSVHVPFVGAVDQPEQVAELLDRHCTDRTVAIYVNTPNNPTGRVVPPALLEALATYGRRHGLWLVSDEVYEDLQFVGTHAYLRALAPERTVSAWSFSKGFGMAGNRVGYVVGPPEVLAGVRKLAAYVTYCAPHVGQVAALHALGASGEAWVAGARTAYADIGRRAAERLGVAPPEGSTFLFLDLADFVGDEPTEDFLRRCVDHGILLAPGRVFGPYDHHVRVCFTAVSPDRTLRGIDVLAGLLGR